MLTAETVVWRTTAPRLMTALAVWVGSSGLVAVMVTVWPLTVDGDVYRPAVVIVPSVGGTSVQSTG